MAVASPELMTAAFLKAYNGRDKRALLALYAHDAVYTRDGTTVVVGIAAIYGVFDSAFASPLRMEGDIASLTVNGGTALLRMHWRLLDAEGTQQRDGISAEVLARGPDGLWRYIIDDATGGRRAPA